MHSTTLQILCSDYARPGTIGYRTFKINSHNPPSVFRMVICRSGTFTISRSICIIPLFPIRLLAVIFAILRINFSFTYNFRDIEVFLFSILAIPFIFVHSFFVKSPHKVVHCWDHSNLLLYVLNLLNYRTVFDLCIAPAIVSYNTAKRFPKFYIDQITTLDIALKQLQNLCRYNHVICPSRFCSDVLHNSGFMHNNLHTSIEPFAFTDNVPSITSNLSYVSYGLHQLSPPEKLQPRNLDFIQKKAVRLGSIGLVNQRKGIRWLVNALNDFQKKYPNYALQLHLFGRVFSSEIPFLESAQFSVFSYGHVDFSLINPFPFFDIQIHASFFEGSAKSIYDGMRNGMPIICTYESGSIIQNYEDGLIFHAGDAKLFSEHLIELITNPSLASNISNSAIKSSARYTWESYASRINSIYQSLI